MFKCIVCCKEHSTQDSLLRHQINSHTPSILKQSDGKAVWSGKRRKPCYGDFAKDCRQSRGIVTIRSDELNLPRALVVAKAHAKKHPSYKNICNPNQKAQTEKAFKLLEKSGIRRIPKEGCGVDELEAFQKSMSKYKITVYMFGSFKGRNVFFDGQNETALYKLNLLYHKGHYNVITSITAAFICKYFCELCHSPYYDKNSHLCKNACPCCGNRPPCIKETEIECNKCNRNFRGQKCFENHATKGPKGGLSLCERIKKCAVCKKTLRFDTKKRRALKHVCGTSFCTICRCYKPDAHPCFVPINDGEAPSMKGSIFVFFDFETSQETPLSKYNTDTKIHRPLLCVSQQCCIGCIDSEDLETACSICGIRQNVFFDGDIVEMFFQHLFKLESSFTKEICLAHNGGRFDCQFMFSHALKNYKHMKINPILRGTEIISLAIDKIKFLDSFKFFPMPLSALPKAFDLGSSLKKGYFPYLFIKMENMNYVGPLPAVNFYDPNTMKSTTSREVFLEWHATTVQSGYIFDFKKEIVEYCVSDVNILRRACVKFRKLLTESCKVCPFSEATTIASTCSLVFRRNFLKPNTISVIPRGGYRCSNNQSKKALQWLVWEERQRGIIIKHAGNQKEVKLEGRRVDGYCEETKQVFEFHGCYWHGHDVCFTAMRKKPLYEDKKDTLESRFERTKTKTALLREKGYTVIEMWECQFDKLIQKGSEIYEYTNNHPILKNTPLNPRDCLYGGRTGNTVEYYQAGHHEKIKYVDVCSLYPWVCKYGKFPINHPVKIVVGDAKCKELISEAGGLKNIDGLIKCSVLPPQTLYHPVLPSKMSNKLLFVLCRSCGETLNQKSACDHGEEERKLHGTWVMDEVVKAVSLGYTVTNIQEIWQYETTQLDRKTGLGGLFREFIDFFLQMKQEASGWPNDCSTEQARLKYIEAFLKSEGVKLRYENIAKNPGLRQLAKLCLNSFWGKFAQRENLPKTAVVNSEESLDELEYDPSIEICSYKYMDDETMLINYEYRDESYPVSSTVNVVVAAYVTTQARLKLYSYLEKLETRVLYYDTDSVVYVSRVDEYDLPTGNFLGDLTDELADEYGSGAYITEFACGGPKSYSFKVYSPIKQQTYEVCKVKGFCLDLRTREKINFDKMKELIMEHGINGVEVAVQNFKRTSDFGVTTGDVLKNFRTCSLKRKFQEEENYTFVPYGFKKFRQDENPSCYKSTS